MTNKEITKAWNKFLDEECDCYADEFGNRPCDYGAVCDRCITVKKMKEFREKYLTNRKQCDIINIENKKRGKQNV